MPVEQINTNQVNYLTIDEDHHDQRIDNFLLGILKGAPRSLVYRLLRKGEVRINKKRAKQTQRLQIGDVVRIAPVRLEQKTEDAAILSKAHVESIEKCIVFEDEHFIVFDKPNGLAVHGGSGIKLGMIEQLRLARPKQKFLELVHRLDRDTSGLILVAKKRAALIALQELFKGKTEAGVRGNSSANVESTGIDKSYLAVVHGHWPKKVNKVDLPLHKYEMGNERMVKVSNEGKTALTTYKLLSEGKNYSLVEAKPITGRTHQIRVHCLSQNCVIAGDEKYRNKMDEDIDKKYKVKRLCLHAYRLRFYHPSTNKLIEVVSEPKGALASIMSNQGLSL